MKKIIFIFFLINSFLSFGRFGRYAPTLSFYWGTTYRLDNSFYNSFDISRENYRSSCTHAHYRGFGFRLDNFNNSNYSISVRSFRSFLRRPGPLLIPYLAISPVAFRMEGTNGLSIKPEIGLRFNTGSFTRRQPVSISLNLSYGYDIPIINERAFLVNRHDLSLKIALSLNLRDVRYFLNSRKQKETQQIKENTEQ